MTDFDVGVLFGLFAFAIGIVTHRITGGRASGWVSVQDRLPEPDEQVLFLTGSGETIAGYSVLEDGDWWQARHSSWGTSAVTHWQPLPSVPKERA